MKKIKKILLRVVDSPLNVFCFLTDLVSEMIEVICMQTVLPLLFSISLRLGLRDQCGKTCHIITEYQLIEMDNVVRDKSFIFRFFFLYLLFFFICFVTRKCLIQQCYVRWDSLFPFHSLFGKCLFIYLFLCFPYN